MSVNKEIKKVTASQIRKMKLDGEKIRIPIKAHEVNC